ncbi:hypothetical protein, partial [Haloferula sp.]|uniref:hypothetical protein n=1 Tax=Haloferula sp. TaxID=2497595 RepID=UPI003C73A7ED
LKYLDYRKPGEYGDPKQKEFQVLIDNSLNKELIEEPERGLLLDLNTGALVKLSWHHDYVTKEGSQFPERVIVDLEPITKEQADSLLSP